MIGILLLLILLVLVFGPVSVLSFIIDFLTLSVGVFKRVLIFLAGLFVVGMTALTYNRDGGFNGGGFNSDSFFGPGLWAVIIIAALVVMGCKYKNLNK